MKLSKIILLFICCCQTLLLSAQTTLPSCIEAAQKNSPQQSLLPLVQEAERLQINALNKSLLPQASLGGQATWQSEVTSVAISLPNVNIPTVAKDQYKATLDLTQSLWDGGLTRSQKKIASASATVDTRNIENNLYALKEQIANLYFGALLAEKQWTNSNFTKNDLENQLKKQNANVQNGTIIKSNALMLEARLIELKQQQREILSRKMAALKGLAILTGKEFSENTQLVEPTTEDVTSTDIARPELQYFEAQSALAEANKWLVKSKNAPKINLFATGGYGRPGLNFLATDFTTYFMGGLTFRIPLSHLYYGSQKGDLQQIDINKSKIDRQREQFLQQTQLKLASQKEDLAKIQDQISEDQKLIEIREYMKKTAEKRLENGVITVSDYISEVDNESIAKQNMSLHQVQLLQAVHAIKITTGKL